MQVMGIISCNIFEDEIVHLVENDREVGEVIIIKNENSGGIVRKLEKIGCPFREVNLVNVDEHRFFRELHLENAEGVVLVLNILEIVGVNQRRTRLKLNVYDAILRMSLFSDGLLLLYGLCGNLLKDIEADFECLNCPVITLKDSEGNIVDDCVCATLGGKTSFIEVVKSLEGNRTFMLTPMWAANWEDMVVANGFARSLELLEESRMVFRVSKYTQVAKINTGLSYQHDFHSKVYEFADYYGLDVREIEADLEIFERCYSELKTAVMYPA
ncbi:TPA: DUF1638 domain-containing protein [Methanosarcinaceae archaeon]|nr:DUF1638 domain-containing protein [Methanosarcinaceae archaeon]